jgi:plasmid stabilization system protein ParE
MRLGFLLEAEEELNAAADFYESAMPGLGREFLAEARRTCQLLAEQPRTGRRLSTRIRRRLLRRFPYSIIYSLSSDAIVILAIAHQRRRPGYWRERTSPK